MNNNDYNNEKEESFDNNVDNNNYRERNEYGNNMRIKYNKSFNGYNRKNRNNNLNKKFNRNYYFDENQF